jgi:hypothetical protein
MFKSTGKIVYSPDSHLGSSKNWAILKCDDNIGAYYRSLYQQQYKALNGGYKLRIIKPIFGAHISYIRNSDTPNLKYWGKNEGKIIEFKYQPGVLDNGKYFWLKIECPFLSELRMQLGLSPQPLYAFHLTIGIAQ